MPGCHLQANAEGDMQAAGSSQALLSQPTQLEHLLGSPMGLANPLTQLLMLGSLASQPLLTGLSPAALTGKPHLPNKS